MLPTSPIHFRPLIKQILWGGRRLGEQLGKPIGDHADYAESWEVVDHGDDQSVVSAGPLEGKSLRELFLKHRPWLLGDSWCDQNPNANTFPLLLKFLDCNRVLSVQVHPDDAYGATMTPPDLGKTEAWVILDAGPESMIYAGLQPSVDRSKLAALIQQGKTEEALHSFHPQVGDCVFIPAGTVHALGGGLLVAEIQQSSDSTFRLFDWNRTDASGKSRQLHIEQSLAVTDFNRGPVSPIAQPKTPGCHRLVECDKFVLSRIDNATQTIAGDGRCHLLSVIKGQATWEAGDATESWSLGQSVLIPAAAAASDITVQGSVLWMTPS